MLGTYYAGIGTPHYADEYYRNDTYGAGAPGGVVGYGLDYYAGYNPGSSGPNSGYLRGPRCCRPKHTGRLF